MRDRTEDVQLMRRIALAMLGVGSVVCGVGVLSKPLTPTAAAFQAAVAVAFAAWFVAIALTRPRRRPLELAALSAIAQLGLTMATSNVVGTTPFFFLWPCVFLAFFGSRRAARTAIGLVAVIAPVCCATNPYLSERVDTAIGTVASVGLMGWLVMAMNARARTLSQALETAANTDPLTGLLNRRGFEPQFQSLIDAARDDATPLSLVAIDVDHFKRFNDTHGHEGGDRALVRLADVLRACASTADRAARVGGEEFVVALPGCDGSEACAFGERVRERLRGLCVPAGETITVSVGTITLDADITTQASLLRCADTALYDSKACGRDRVTRWNTGLAAVAGTGTETVSPVG